MIKCSIETITPTIATSWLKSNTHNRKLNPLRVQFYAAQMSRGDWFVTNSGVGFDEGDRLIDGQHRLSAVIESGETVEMLVVRGLAKRSQLVVDQPMVRRLHDQLTLT